MIGAGPVTHFILFMTGFIVPQLSGAAGALGATGTASATSSTISAAPTLKQRQDCEVAVTKALHNALSIAPRNDSSAGPAEAPVSKDALQNAQQKSLQKALNDALKKWPECYIAQEQLGVLAEKGGNLKGALDYFIIAKHNAPDERWPFLNFHIGRLFLDLRSDDRAELYLKVALNQGAFPVQTGYLLGYLYYKQGRYFEAEPYFRAAVDYTTHALHPTSIRDESLWDTDLQFIQACRFYLGEIYALEGFERRAVRNLQEAEVGESPEMRRAAWLLHANLNRAVKTYSFGASYFYDSNIALLGSDQPLPSELSGQASHGLKGTAFGSYQSSPARSWGYGIDGSAAFKYHLTANLNQFDSLELQPAFWVGYWNLKTWDFTARYEVSRVGLSSFSFPIYEMSHGPILTYSFFPDLLWTYSASYRLLMKSYSEDSLGGSAIANDRSGIEHELTIRAAMDGLNPRIKPWGQYRFSLNTPSGDHYRYLGNALELGLDALLIQRWHALASFGVDYRSYDSAVPNRTETHYLGRLALRGGLLRNMILSIDLIYDQKASTSALYAWGRTALETGVVWQY